MKSFPDGVWPTMITPFTEKNEIDYEKLDKMIEWYIKNEVNGLFAVCQSSEMFFLSLEERVELALFVKKQAKGRVPVIASGHISDTYENQIEELNLMAESGVDAIVLITNRLAKIDESDDVLLKNLEKLLKQIPENVALGFYECPYPYKRLISPELLKFCADTGRFFFLKDTSCDSENIKAKLDAIKDTGLKIFNANSATLLESMILGISGYSGIMANFHPSLYVWLCNNFRRLPKEAELLQDLLGIASVVEFQTYPVNAKYHMQLEGVNIELYSRVQDCNLLGVSQKLEIQQMRSLINHFSKNILQAN